ncbi:hypothetical protein BU23DRAFT_251811 [Bimuria novae-zelandiae CBS 107.79]|uniref:HIT-type domain-containing protein n=1 Tax=Bimuria novae-zelandiae CBS 107.79 TaxID=1447943 RepID=A0A6A5VKC3_9PLEO|nr:hypothetical protein BU23DRAFT_251811 [Bimuria novae-zelandiae CBS 107.79]
MSDPTICGICAAAPKKYKCPTCALPYCSLPCFKAHKPTHASSPSEAVSTTEPAALVLPTPAAPPPPVPKYLRAKKDFSPLGADARFQELLKHHPTLLPTLQRVYAATIEPEENDAPRPRGMRGRGARGHWRGRGRGRGGWGGDDRPRWTPKRGDEDAMRMLKGLREGRRGEVEKEGIGEFVRLVGEMFGEGRKEDEERG